MRIPDLGLDRESAIGRVPAWAWVLLITASAVWLLGPRVSGWQLVHLHKEDGAIFLQEWVRDGWSSMFAPYTGYQHLGARVATAACASGPVSWFAPCVGGVAALVRILLAIVVSAVLVPYTRTRAWGIAAGFLFVFVPVGQQEVLGNITNLRWFFDAGCLFVSVGLFRGRMSVLASVLGFVGAMSDPLVLLLLPLAAWRMLTAPQLGRALPAAAVAAGAVCHWLLLVPSARPTDLGWYVRDPGEALVQLLARGPAVAQFGQNGVEVLIHGSILLAVAAGVVPLFLAALSRPRGGPRAMVAILILAGVGILAATLVFAPHDQLELDPAWQLGNGSRYSVGPSLLLGAAVLVAVSYARGRAVGAMAVALFGLAAVGDLTGDSWNSHGPTWATSVDDAVRECRGDSDVAEVQLTPTDVPTEWIAEVSCSWLLK
ncbi:hypothetical protein SAMN04489844_0814 [Nocardioides exalbidus]|uniref:Uncharacterized protein n=1 Tax=Nocardioides exalbidus TaxID=402596 RepID=A0A1H4L9X9_9ACTN|nr:hypothetical protein [Nocardioides exalbidus]SEB67296.1 hypothetical protein SAMN04489844_0814 [Nocardioides exalbidus]